MRPQCEQLILIISLVSLIAPLASVQMVQAGSEDPKIKSRDQFNEAIGTDPEDAQADAQSKVLESSGGLEVAASAIGISSTTIESSSSASAFGDFNGDLYEDLAIGVPGESLGAGNTIPFAGAVNVIYGSTTGLQATGTGGPDDQFWNQDSTSVKDAAEEGDRFGQSLAAGDFNNDGKSDLAVGAALESTSTLDHIGAVNVIYGSTTGLQATGT